MRSIITIICALIIVLTTPDEAGAQNFIIEYSGGAAFTVLDSDNLKLTGRIKLVNEGDKVLYIDSTAIPVYVHDALMRVTYTGIYIKYAGGREALYAGGQVPSNVSTMTPTSFNWFKMRRVVSGYNIFATEHQRWYAVAMRPIFKPVKYYIGDKDRRYIAP